MALEENNNISDPGGDKIILSRNLGRWLKSLLKIWWLFLLVGFIAGMAGVFYASKQKITYKSRLTFALDDGTGSNGIGNFMSLASQFGLNLGSSSDIFAGDNILDIMKSRRMVESVLLSSDTFNTRPYTLIEYFLDLMDRRANPKINEIHFPPGQPKSNFSYQQDSLLFTVYREFANSYIEAQRPDRKLSIYEVNFTSANEKFTKDFTDRLIAETNSFYIEIRTKKAKKTLDILEERAANMKGNLNSSIANRAAIQDVNVNPAFSAAQVPVLKQQTNIQVYSTAYGEMFKNLEIARFQYLNEIPLMQIIDAADYPMQKIRVGKLKTGMVFSLVSCVLLLFIFWLIRILKFSRIKSLK
ncbi:MAG TPA: hypothetical protein VIJ92_05520 [Ginsengibacter sp.]